MAITQITNDGVRIGGNGHGVERAAGLPRRTIDRG
jgi:hypothetical protein